MNAKIVYALIFVAILSISSHFFFGANSNKVLKMETHQQNVNFCMNNPLSNRCSN